MILFSKKIIQNVLRLYRRPETQLFIITACVHGAVAVLLASGVVSIPSSASDHLAYHEEATQIASLLRSGTYTWGAVYVNHWYPLFVGVLYVVFGAHMAVGVFANALLAAGAAALCFRVVRTWGATEPVAFWFSLLIFNAYASLLYQTSMLLKEAWIIFLLMAMFSIITDLAVRKTFSVWKFLLTLALFVLLRNLRFFIGFAAITGFFAAWFLQQNMGWKKKIGYGMLMLLAVSCVSLLLSGKEGAFKSPTIAEYVHPAYISDLRADYFKNGETTTHIQLVKKIPSTTSAAHDGVRYFFSLHGVIVSLSNALLGPFPSQLSLSRYLYAALDLVWWYPFFILSIIGIVSMPFRKSAPYLVVAAIIGAGVLVGADNLGALMRYRIPAFAVIALFATIGFAVLQNACRKNIVQA